MFSNQIMRYLLSVSHKCPDIFHAFPWFIPYPIHNDLLVHFAQNNLCTSCSIIRKSTKPYTPQSWSPQTHCGCVVWNQDLGAGSFERSNWHQDWSEALHETCDTKMEHMNPTWKWFHFIT